MKCASYQMHTQKEACPGQKGAASFNKSYFSFEDKFGFTLKVNLRQVPLNDPFHSLIHQGLQKIVQTKEQRK